MVVLGALGGLIGIAAIAQAIRIGLVRGDWIAIKLLIGLIVAAVVLVLAMWQVSAGE